MKTCYQRKVMDMCDCADSQVEKYGMAFGYRNMTACDIRNVSQGKSGKFEKSRHRSTVEV